MIISRRAATNVVATMLIFALMIASVGVLYAQIAPTLLGYETRGASVNQEFVFTTIANEGLDLASSTEGTASRIHIVSEDTVYDIIPNQSFDITIDDGSTTVSESVDIASFQSTINGSFQPSDENFVNRVVNEDTYLNNDTGEPNYVIKSSFDYSEGTFSMYFRAQIDVFQTNPSTNTWKISVRIIQIDFQKSGGEPLIFPVDIDEWTLRLLRKASDVLPTTTFSGVSSVDVTHSLNGIAGTAYTYNFPAGATVNVEIMTIPIFFGF